MRIACSFPVDDAEAPLWVKDLSAALSGAEVFLWKQGDPSADYAVVWKPTQEFLSAQSALKAIFNAGAGVDALASLDLPASVPLIRLEDAGMADQMSEYTAHAVLHHYREFDRYADQATACTWQPRRPRVKSDYPVGILGFGVLGMAVASTLRGLGFTVHAWAHAARTAQDIPVYAGANELRTFLEATRILVCLLPLTPRTKHILNGRHFGLLKRGAYLVNVARGGHLLVDDLLGALSEGQLSGATLDVFEDEPLPRDSPLWRHPLVRVTPHVAAATLRSESVKQMVRKIEDLERGLPVSGVVQRVKGY